MTRIRITPDAIEARGHAGDRIACARISTILSSLMTNLLDRHGLDVAYEMPKSGSRGFFYLDRRGIPPGAPSELVDAAIYSLTLLAEQNPNSFRMITEECTYDG